MFPDDPYDRPWRRSALIDVAGLARTGQVEFEKGSTILKIERVV